MERNETQDLEIIDRNINLKIEVRKYICHYCLYMQYFIIPSVSP